MPRTLARYEGHQPPTRRKHKMGRFSWGYVASKALRLTYQRIATDLGGPARALNLRTSRGETFHSVNLKNLPGNRKNGESLLKGHFIYSGQHIDVGQQGDPWTLAAPSERFAFWLHSFDWLPDLATLNDKSASIRSRFLVDRWIEMYGDWNPYAWDNDIIANRLFAWLSVWNKSLSTDKLSDVAFTRRTSVVRQLKRLRKTYARTTPGLPKFKAATVLALGGLLIQHKSEGFLERGLDWLIDEIDAQILPDGGHISRSPETSLQALHMLYILAQALNKRRMELPKPLLRAIERLQHIIPFFLHTDGLLTSFHGGGEGQTSKINALLKGAEFQSKPFVYCPHTGYQRVEQNGSLIIMDTGDTPPHPYDLESHLSPLAFEMSTEAGRLIVNCGWNKDQPLSWQQVIRSTAAHSTLTLSNQSAGRILRAGLKTKVLGPAIDESIENTRVSRKEQASGIWIEASHHGYLNRIGLSHRRRLYMKSTGTDIRGEDSLLVPIGYSPKSRGEVDFDIRFHLHPDVRATLAQDLNSALLIQPGHVGWRFRTDGGPMRIEESVYLGTGDQPVKSQQIVISGKAYADSDGETKSNRIRWSFRQLEAKMS